MSNDLEDIIFKAIPEHIWQGDRNTITTRRRELAQQIAEALSDRDERLLGAHAMLGAMVTLAEGGEAWPYVTKQARRSYNEARKYQAQSVRNIVDEETPV